MSKNRKRDRTPPKPSYEVGYGKPPIHSQFRKNESGNPNGRPKGSRNLRTILETELTRRVRITENGKTRSASKLEAIIAAHVNKAAMGNDRAFAKVIELVLLVLEGKESASETDLSEDDRAVIETYIASLNSNSNTGKEDDHV